MLKAKHVDPPPEPESRKRFDDYPGVDFEGADLGSFLPGKTLTSCKEACATNPSLLNTRLRELRAAEVVEHDDGGYRLTAQGRKLLAALQPLGEWAQRWGRGGRQLDGF